VFCSLQNTPKSVFGRGSAPDPAGGTHDAPPDPLVGWRGDTPPIPHPTRHGPTFGARHASPQKSRQIYAYANTLRKLAKINLHSTYAYCRLTNLPGDHLYTD